MPCFLETNDESNFGSKYQTCSISSDWMEWNQTLKLKKSVTIIRCDFVKICQLSSADWLQLSATSVTLSRLKIWAKSCSLFQPLVENALAASMSVCPMAFF